MNSGILDTIVLAFVGAIQSGTATLLTYSLPILAFAALVAWYSSYWPVVMGGGNEGFSTALWLAIKIGIFYWMSVSLAALALAAFQSFLTWGTAPSGGVFSAESFLHPSGIVDLGFRAALPIQEFLQGFTGMSALWNFPTVIVYMIAYWLIVLSFAMVALHLVIAIVEFHLAVMLGAVLIPWGVLSAVAFLAEFSLSWVIAGLIRILITAAIMSIAIPLFDGLSYTTSPGGDPTLYSAVIFGLAAGMFAILAWVIPSRAAAVGGRGMAIGLTGGVLLPQTGVRAAMVAARGIGAVGAQALQGASRMIQARRGGRP